uniref:Uncharacterized protein n=1 Tax=Pararge aegeria TaxID=116150 RepID=S4P0A6_9NEOP
MSKVDSLKCVWSRNTVRSIPHERDTIFSYQSMHSVEFETIRISTILFCLFCRTLLSLFNSSQIITLT